MRSSRVKHVRSESNLSPEQANKRIAWEASHRAASSVQVSVTVAGWTQGGDQLWQLNQRTRCTSPTLGINADFLITDLGFSLGESGSETTITLAPVGVLTPMPEVPKMEGLPW